MDHRRIEWLFFVIFLAISTFFLGIELWRTPTSLVELVLTRIQRPILVIEIKA